MLIGAEGKVEQIILDAGGFLGLGRKLVAVPFLPIKITDRGIVYSITKEQLLKSPAFHYGKGRRYKGPIGDRDWKEEWKGRNFLRTMLNLSL